MVDPELSPNDAKITFSVQTSMITEKNLMQSVVGRAGGRTTILITHRLVAMEHMDEIVVLDRGRIVERGSHGELLARQGLYQELHNAQNLELDFGS